MTGPLTGLCGRWGGFEDGVDSDAVKSVAMLGWSANPPLLLLYEPQAADMLAEVLIERSAELESRVSTCEKLLVVRTPFTADEVKSSVTAGFIVWAAVEGGIFLTTGLAQGSAEGSPPNESCLVFLMGFGVSGVG